MFPTEETYYESTVDLRVSAYESYDADPADPWNYLFEDYDVDPNLLQLSISAREVAYDNLKESGATRYDISDFLEEFFDVITKNGAFDQALDKMLDGTDDFVDNFGQTGTNAATYLVLLVKKYIEVAGAIHQYFSNPDSIGVPSAAPFNQLMVSTPTVLNYLVSDDEVIKDIRGMYQRTSRKETVFKGGWDPSDGGGFEADGGFGFDGGASDEGELDGDGYGSDDTGLDDLIVG